MGLLIFFLLFLFVGRTLQQVLVQTPLGKIQGTTLKSHFGADIFTFLGIPYAQPPTGESRFTAPVPIQPWQNTLNATTDAPVCPQFFSTFDMSEDCLFLNVYSPNLTGNASVIVYIHGGANVVGTGRSTYEAGPQYLLDQNVVLVTFNYRLGPLGFLSTKTKEAPGNYGYLDQVLVLNWVKDNIRNFGGNPNSVTLMGLSSGGMSVGLHLASPLSRNLFHRAISMSGAPTDHFVIDNVGWTHRLAREVGCPLYDPKDVVDCLRNVPWNKIIAITLQWEPYFLVNVKWNYEIDNFFLQKHPSQYFYEGDFNHVPIMAGITKNEFDFSAYGQENNTGLLHDISVNFDRYAPELFTYDNKFDICSKNKSERIRAFYFGNQTSITRDNLDLFGEIFSDSVIGHGTHRLVDFARSYTKVFYYRFDYLGKKSGYVDDKGNLRGVIHGDDLRYVMPGTHYGVEIPTDDPDMFMVKRSVQLYTSFAKTGVPSAPDAVKWIPCDKTTTLTFYNDRKTRMDQPPYKERYALWDSLFPYPLDMSKFWSDWFRCAADFFKN